MTPAEPALPPLTPNLSRAATGLFMHAPLAFLNSLFAGGKGELRPDGEEEKRRPGVASRLAGVAFAAAFILAPDDETW